MTRRSSCANDRSTNSRAAAAIRRGHWFRQYRAFAAFERQDYSAAIDALEPIAGELERIGGSRAQLDLVEFTLLKAYVGADRLDEARRMLSLRRRGPSQPPVAGLPAAVH